MAMEPTQTGGLSAETRAVIGAVLDAVDIPHAATVAHDETRTKILGDRILYLEVNLELIAERDRADELPHDLEYLREKLAETPAGGYVTDEQARERRAAGATWRESVSLDYRAPDVADAADEQDGDERRDPNACVTCGRNFTSGRAVIPNVPVGRVDGVLMFACGGCAPGEDEQGGDLIPAPTDPVLRTEWEAGVAAREAAGLSGFVGEDYPTDVEVSATVPGPRPAGEPAAGHDAENVVELAGRGPVFERLAGQTRADDHEEAADALDAAAAACNALRAVLDDGRGKNALGTVLEDVLRAMSNAVTAVRVASRAVEGGRS